MIRHGMTEGNEKRQYIGRTDQSLSEKGRLEAEKRKKFFYIPKVHTSSKQRALETARILFPNSQIEMHKELDEMDFGDFEGRSYQDMQDDLAYRSWVQGGCLDRCPNGEDIEKFEYRVWKCFIEIIEKNRWVGTAYFVVHGGTIQAVLHRLKGGDFFDYHMQNLGGYRWDMDERNFSLTNLEKFEVERIGL